MAAPAALAACRITDFSDRPLSSLNDVERLSFLRQMTQTEYASLKQAAPGSRAYLPLVARSASRADVQADAAARLAALQMQNVEAFATIWASDFLSDEKLKAFVDCTSSRRPGIVYAGRLASPNTFNLAFAHITPNGIEKIRLRLVGSQNIANAAAFEAFLDQLGEQGNYPPQMFPLTFARPGEPAVLILRAGWETPLFVYIPAYPAPAAS